MDTRRKRAQKRVAAPRRQGPSFDGRLYRRPDAIVERGYGEFHESRFARYDACSDS